LNPRLTQAFARARAAVRGEMGAAASAGLIELNNPTVRPAEPPAPVIRVSLPTPTLAARPAPSCEPLEALTDLDALPRGPRRLLELLHRLAVDTVTARQYPVTPSQVTMHQAQELMAQALGCHVVTVWRWLNPLKAAGLVDARAHFTTSQGVTRADGTLFAVALKVGHRAHLTHDDLSHEWRDLDADRKAGRTAWAALQGSDHKTTDEWMILLRRWAVAPGSTSESRCVPDPCSAEEDGPRTVQDVVYLLPLVGQAHPTKRPALVGLLASTLARALDDQHSRRWYCRLIWNAFTDEVEGRGGLQVLAAQLARLDVDRRPGEWQGLRRAPALLAARLRAA